MNRYKPIAIILAIAVIAVIVIVLAVPKLLDRGGSSGDQAAESTESGDEAARGNTATTPQSSPSERSNAPANTARGANNADLPAVVASAAEQANAIAPVRIDEVTTMTGATSQGTRIRYRYDVSRPIARQEIGVLRDRLMALNQRNVCQNDSIREVVEAGATIEYAYYGPGGEFLFSTPVARC